MYGSRLWPKQNIKPKFEYHPQLNGTNRLSNGLIALWLINESAGPLNSIVKKSGALYKATTSGTPVPTFVDGIFGNNVQIATSSVTTQPSFISTLVPHQPPPVTLAAVCYPTEVITNNHWLLNYQTGTTNDGFRFGARTNWDFTFGGVADYLFSTLTITVNQWYTFVVTVSGNGGTAIAYLYNWNTKTYQTQSITVGTMAGTALNKLTIGADGTNNGNWVGVINNVALWNRALSAAEVKDFIFFPYGTSTDPLLIVSPRRTYSIPQSGVEAWVPIISQPAPPKYVILSF